MHDLDHSNDSAFPHGMEGCWAGGRRPRMGEWWGRTRARPSYREAIRPNPSFAEIQPQG